MRFYLSPVVALLAPLTASASTFDPDTGRLSLEASDYAVSFDSLEGTAELAPVALNLNFRPMSDAVLATLFLEDEEGLEGGGALSFGGQSLYLALTFDGLAERFRGRRVELRLWQQPQGTRATGSLSWYSGEMGSRTDPSRRDDAQLLGLLALRPTGRVTDDGWEEWSSGPFDWSAGGEIPPLELVLYDDQFMMLYYSYFAGYDETARVLLDAFEIVDLGPAAVAPIPCTAVDEVESCGSAGLCLLGRCADAAMQVGQIPEEGLRADYVARRTFELAAFEGGRLPRSLLGEFDAAVAPLAAEESAGRFWTTLSQAVQELRDGHASAPTAGYPFYASVGACLHLGEADLLPDGGELPLLFYSDVENPVTAQLEEGDALVAIDDLPPELWAVQARRLLFYGGDPEGFTVNTTPQLIDAALATSATLTFSRWGAVDGEERFDIDLGELVGESVWGGAPPDWLSSYTECDYRFRRAMDDPEVRGYEFAGYADQDGVRTLLINGVPGSYSEEGAAWSRTVREALDDTAAALVLDQRSGAGGTTEAVDVLATLLLAPDDFYAMDIFPALDRDIDPALRAGLASCSAGDDGGLACGHFMRWILGENHDPPAARGLAGSAPLAVLNGSDVSGNDFVSQLLTYRGAETRIFGPAPTYGAFGSVVALPTHYQEVAGGSVQIGDTQFLVAPDAEPTAFTTGVGVPPDERVLQKQSDAVAGVDSVVAAAEAWLAERRQ